MDFKVGDICPECKKGSLVSGEEGELLCDGCGSKAKKKEKYDSVFRIDNMSMLWEPTQKLEKTGEGFLKGRAAVTNIGVFTYRTETGGIRREARMHDEVFNEDSLNSLSLKPLTNDHPAKGVSADTYKGLTVGSIGEEIYQDGTYIYAPVMIADAKAIADVEGGKVALSCGYTCDLEFKKGVFLGVEYDAIQKNIRYNHVAIVDSARAGDAAKLRTDSIDGVCISVTKSKEIKMAKLTLDSAEFEVPEAVASHILVLQGKSDKAEQDNKVLKEDHSKILADRDNLQSKLDSVSKELEDAKVKLDAAPASIEVAVAKRVALIKVAQDCGVEVKADASDLDIQKAVIVAAFPKADLADKDGVYIAGRYDAAIEVLADVKKADSSNQQNLNDKPAEKPVVKADAAEAHKKMVAELESAYKTV